jgi:hypothetical protein
MHVTASLLISPKKILLVEDEEEKVSGVCVGPTNTHEPSAEEEVGSADSSGEDDEEGD